ncbi:MAG: DUF3515 family protein [Pseudonocardiaceae bacterium]|nr:DUF3515 family protein [Pseudonocardiaceae bacterium]
MLAVAIGLPSLLVITVVITAVVLRNQEPGPLGLTPVPAPEARFADCARLLSALPEEVDARDAGELDRRAIAAPAPPGTAAWGQPAVVLRCGLGRPAELTATSRLLDVSGVQFLELPGPASSSWLVVDRSVYVAVTLPDSVGSGPLQQVAGTVRETLPRQDVEVGN